MKLEHVRIRNMGPFREFSINVAKLPGPLVAVVGENGAGKSTFLELAFAGAMYRQTPTRGSLLDLATGRDAGLQSVISYGGANYSLQHLVDAIGKKSEASAVQFEYWDGDGGGCTPCFDSSKVRDFDRWAERALPSPEVLYTTIFAAQQSGGFLAAKPGDRKATLLRVLGIARFEAMSASCRDYAREQRAALDILHARLADERARGGDVAEIEATLATQREHAAGTAIALSAAQERLAAAEEQRRQQDAQREEATRVSAQRADLERRRDNADRRHGDICERLRNNRRVLAEAEQIRAAVARVDHLRSEIARVDTAADQAARDAERLEDESAAIERRAKTARSRAKAAAERLRDREQIEAAVAALPELRDAVAAAQGGMEFAERNREELIGKRVAGAADRIGGLRSGLDLIRRDCRYEAAIRLGEIAVETLDDDTRSELLATELPQQIAEAESNLRAARDTQAVAQRALAAAETLAARAEGLEQADSDMRVAEREAAELEEQARLARQSSADRAADEEAHRAKALKIQRVLAEVEELAAKAGPLAAAEARIAELEPQVAQVAAEIEALEGELAALPAVEAPGAVVFVEHYRTAVDDAERAARDAQASVTRTEQRIEQARESVERISELECERRTVESELADWTRLAADLGRDGLQALEIDAAGPELTEFANDLLHACHGPRFTVRVDTQRLSGDGKRMLEGCEVVVLDTQNGREAPGETFSGGERVIISEALSLALSMLACRRSGLSGVTLVRDESGAALDPENGRAWIAMLRRAAQIVGADKVLFVAHNQELIDMADATIDVCASSTGLRI